MKQDTAFTNKVKEVYSLDTFRKFRKERSGWHCVMCGNMGIEKGNTMSCQGCSVKETI